nr:MAG TPA: hypothetical protein [Bacteriophage sp.]DAM66226.1 MAG TPA: hypothetical protein [Caudoviricetes sp.]
MSLGKIRKYQKPKLLFRKGHYYRTSYLTILYYRWSSH